MFHAVQAQLENEGREFWLNVLLFESLVNSSRTTKEQHLSGLRNPVGYCQFFFLAWYFKKARKLDLARILIFQKVVGQSENHAYLFKP